MEEEQKVEDQEIKEGTESAVEEDYTVEDPADATYCIGCE